MLERHTFVLPTRVEYGADVVDTVGKEAEKLGGGRVLIVTDQGVNETGLVDLVRDMLDHKHVKSFVFSDVVPNPRDHDCVTGAACAGEVKADLLVAIGGGSVMDTAKTIACLVTHGGKPQDWVGVPLEKDVLPVICIPTTAGTGSEVTSSAVITDTERKFKMTLSDVRLAPRVALVDPAVTLSMPRGLTASTGMDALTHAIEAYTCKLAQPITDGLALQAIQLICRSIRTAVQDGSNLEARSDMMLGSLIAGMAFGNADVAGVHCLAEALGGLYDTPHGVANSVFLPYVFEFNVPSNPAKHAAVATAMGLNVSGLSEAQACESASEELKKMSRDIGIPRLRDLPGVNSKDFPFLAENSAKNGSNLSNPREATKEDYLALLEKAYASG